MAKKQTPQRVMDIERGTVGISGEVYAAVAASGPAVGTSPPPTDLSVIGNVLTLSAQTPMARIRLQWRKPLLAQEVRLYQVQVATNAGFTTGVIYFNASDTSISIDVVTSTAGIAYWFRVRVLSGGVVSDWSASVTATSTADTTPAGQPTSLAWEWSGADLVLTWVNPTNANLKDIEVRIWESASKVTLYHTGYSATGRYAWTLPQQRIDTSGVLDPAVYVELRSRTWSNVLGTTTIPGTNPTNAVPSAPSSVSVISSIGTLMVTVAATAPSDFQAYRFRLIQTLPSAADVVWDSPSALQSYALYAQATYQVGVKILDVYGQLSSETLSSASAVDTLTIGSLRAEVIYSDADANSDATLHVPLSDGILASGGQVYATTATWNKWTRAERPSLDRYRTVTLSMTPASGTSSWYLRLSSDGSTWTYYAGPVTSSRILTLVANAAAAQSAAVSAATLGGSTTSRVELPTNVEARFVEVWVRNATPANTRLDEFYPRRVVEADDIKVQNLSGISADLGTITAGTINSVVINSSTINAGGGTIVIDTTGMSIVRDTTTITGARPAIESWVPSASHALRFVNGGTVHGQLGQTSITYTSPAVVYNELLLATTSVASQVSQLTLHATHSSLFSGARLLASSGAGFTKSASVSVSADSGASTANANITADTIAFNGDITGSGNYATSGSIAAGASINAAVRLFAKGIGTTSATYCFNAQNSAGTNIIYCRDDGLSNFISSAWSSDRRHKQHIRAIDAEDLDRFRQLSPYHYIRTNGPGGPEYGVIAQDVQELFPDWVSTDPDGALSVRYHDLIALLMADNHSLHDRLAAVERRLAA